jgi:hypothetical protein
MTKILSFFAQTAATFCKNVIITLVFEKNAHVFAENWQKSQIFLTITLTPDSAKIRLLCDCLLRAVFLFTKVSQSFGLLFPR